MDDIYLVEIRLGRTRWRVNRLVSAIAATYGIVPFMERHPHVTLFGPFELDIDTTQQQVLDAIGNVAAGFDPVPFLIGPFERREGMHGGVLAFSVTPSEQLAALTRGLVAALLPLTRTHNAWDSSPELKWYHVTIANRLDRVTADLAYADLAGTRPERPPGRLRACLFRLGVRTRRMLYSGTRHPVRPLLIDESGLRITVLHGNAIVAEYDLLEKRWIADDHRQSGTGWQATLARFRDYAGFERSAPRTPEPGDVLLIADLHLGHANIIRYCSRPFFFADPAGMDRVLITNWNATVPPGTRAYHLGDLRYGRDALPEDTYRSRLTGEITFIAGNHDEPRPDSPPSAVIEQDGLQFFLVHDPADAPAGFDGWVVHGHHHNNDLASYPFVDFTHRRINVSAEVAGYVPVSLAALCRLIRYRTQTQNLAPVLLNYSATGYGPD